MLDILNDLDFTNIKYNKMKDEIRFSREEGSNPSAVVLYIKTLHFQCFSTGEIGDIYTLVMDKKGVTFPQSLKYVAKKLGILDETLNIKQRLPFGGFYHKLIKETEEPESNIQTYDKSLLIPYLHKYNTMFFNDGIDFKTQEEYEIGYDILSGRITFPVWTLNGELCGIMGRLNTQDCNSDERWLPIIPCPRSLTLSAYHRNYQKIQKKGLCIIGESDKFPAQLNSFGCKIGLATNGCHISNTQAKYIKALRTPKIIIAYDEGLEEEAIRESANKLVVNNPVYHNHVGYIYDTDNEILKKGLKQSPSDLGKERFAYLATRKVKWLQ